MSGPARQARPPAPAGLCERCVHLRLVENDRGSRFVLCGLSERDPRFVRYPRLPVLACRGFVPHADDTAGEPPGGPA